MLAPLPYDDDFPAPVSTSGGGIFGAPAAPAPSGGGLFGSSSTPAPAPSAGGLFGAPGKERLSFDIY